jgi:predicted nucleotidyltransferase component of viral defense system
MIPQRNISLLSNRLAKEGATIQVYSLKEILSEKVVALTGRARNEPRDLYDVWYLTERENMTIP